MSVLLYRCGIDEDLVEYWHNKDNHANRLVANTKTFIRAEEMKARRRSVVVHDPEVNCDIKGVRSL
jgi:hypothetical protein